VAVTVENPAPAVLGFQVVALNAVNLTVFVDSDDDGLCGSSAYFDDVVVAAAAH